MNYTEFKNGLEKGEVYPIYLFEGEDAFFRERGLSLLKSKFISQPELNYSVFQGDNFALNDLMSSLTAYPFMSEKRMTVIRDFLPKANGIAKELKGYLEQPIKESILVIVNEKPSEALKKFQQVNVVDCKKADASIISRYVKGKCATAGVSIDLESAKTLSEFCLNDMTRVENETEKLISYCFDKKQITIEDIELMVVKDTEFKIFEMTDYIGKKQFDQAILVINDMLSKGENMQRLLVSVYNYFRRLLHVAISDKSDAELAKLLNVKEFAVKKTRTQAKAFKKKSLKQAVDMLTETDYLIKSGRVMPDERIWQNLFSIMAE